MARSLSTNMYGADETSYASSVSDMALETSETGAAATNLSDNWGPTKDDDRAFAKGNTPEYEDYEVKILRKTNAGGGDGESLLHPYPQKNGGGRHKPGPSKSEDVGGGITDPPPSRATSAKQSGYPKYNKG